MARTNRNQIRDPRGLVPWVKEAARLLGESVLAAQPDSPSRQAGWGLSFVAFLASCSTFFTIHARWMGARHDLFRTTIRLRPAARRAFVRPTNDQHRTGIL